MEGQNLLVKFINLMFFIYYIFYKYFIFSPLKVILLWITKMCQFSNPSKSNTIFGCYIYLLKLVGVIYWGLYFFLKHFLPSDPLSRWHTTSWRLDCGQWTASYSLMTMTGRWCWLGRAFGWCRCRSASSLWSGASHSLTRSVPDCLGTLALKAPNKIGQRRCIKRRRQFIWFILRC